MYKYTKLNDSIERNKKIVAKGCFAKLQNCKIAKSAKEAIDCLKGQKDCHLYQLYNESEATFRGKDTCKE